MQGEADITIETSLTNIYSNCNIKITNLVTEQATLGNQLRLTPTFDFSGIDENCPEMTATVWLEPPEMCSMVDDCPNEGLSHTIPASKINNGTWTEEFVLDTKINGCWNVHVTVTPSEFDCAMPLLDECSE
jgi:hypothetical protein